MLVRRVEIEMSEKSVKKSKSEKSGKSEKRKSEKGIKKEKKKDRSHSKKLREIIESGDHKKGEKIDRKDGGKDDHSCDIPTDLSTDHSSTHSPNLPADYSSTSTSTQSSASSEEDDDALLVTPETEAEVLRTFARLKAKDPRLYSPTLPPLYNEELLQQAEEKWKRSKNSTPKNSLNVRQAQHNQLLQTEEAKDLPPAVTPNSSESTLSELESIKQAFSAEAAQSPEEDEFLTLKPKSPSHLQAEEAQFKTFLFEALSAEGSQDDWLTLKAAQEATPEDRFLLQYILNRGWVGGNGQSDTPLPPLDATDLNSEDQFLQQAEEFEFKHNFRFEAASSSPSTDPLTIPTHPRTIEESVRTLNTKSARRARQREAKRERTRLEKIRLEETLKRTKNELSSNPDNEEAYFKEHWEGILDGGTPCRFKYRQVPASSFGLSSEDILEVDDSLLNAHASSKCLAAYFDVEQHEHWHAKCTDKRRLQRFWGMKRAAKEKGSAWAVSEESVKADESVESESVDVNVKEDKDNQLTLATQPAQATEDSNTQRKARKKRKAALSTEHTE